ncbi:SusC/RagA family TonB-linked outer membrane protein [Ferruginibacter sp.]
MATTASAQQKKADTVVINNEQPVELIYTQSARNLTAASTDAVYSKDILKSPVTSFRNAITGRLAGLYTLQSSGLPGSDGASLTLRGKTPIIIIDGVVANLTTFDLEEIESVTVLKDALATAMLGVRGSNGAILVTTKKGKAGNQQISFTAQTAIQQSIAWPETLNAYNYALLHNEALRNDGVDSAYSGLYYSQNALNAYKNGTDPVNYPNVNYREQVTNKTAQFSKYTLSATGGNKFARYFVSLEHANQSGFFKTVDSTSYNTNNNFKSYVVRSNVDVNITPKLSGGIYLLGRIMNANEPGATTGSILSSIMNTPANAYPLLNSNNSFGGNQQYQNNVLAQTIASGYRQRYYRDILVNIYLQRSLDEVLKGLWIRAKAAYNSTLAEDINRSKSFAVFQQTGSNYIQFGSNGTQGNSNGIAYQGRGDYEELSLGYSKNIGKIHDINALLLFNRDNSTSGSDLPYTISGTSARVSYVYKNKFTAEGALAYNGSNRYPDDGSTKRGFFPSIGFGWNIDREKFMQSVPVISKLRVYTSYGKTGWDNPGYFVYYPRFFDGATGYFGTGAGGVTTITEGTLPNVNITWEKANKYNAGIAGALLNNHLNFSAEYFSNKYYDLLQQRGASSTTIGNDYPDENIGKNKYYGWEFQLGWQQSVKELQYFVNVNATFLNSKVIFMDEVSRQYSWMQRTGQPIGRIFGYVADGLFQSQAEINSSATTTGYKAQPGDIKYKDLNNDGVINQNDQTGIGSGKALIMGGLSMGVSYKGFDISALFQGMANRDIYASGSSYWAFAGGTGQAYSHNLQRWTPATAASATYPRLSYGDNSNNYAVSSYWIRNGNYLRLKNLEVGYAFPTKLIKKTRLNTIRLFANSYNLFTIKSDELDGRDPEGFTGGYPIQRLFNFGINIKF